jgi:hypothetical protein
MAALPIYGQAQAATGTDPQSPQHQRIFRGSVGLNNFNSIASVACSTFLPRLFERSRLSVRGSSV